MFDLREVESVAGDGEEESFEQEDTKGEALEGAERASEEKRAARGREREMGRKDTILENCLRERPE